ncbi:high affinity immunoglobulin gamma Fc receptor IB isoform X2 [Scophthalmus maximus]|uniref:high affinity immunoglobulin gamma Fc receptor IB isoform X2 n=1 Tax=Scophthalmus maximus TaxID=52904 RepID=UPI001FA8F11D|nr:high affinity immunoglobulin gamma Fc receptor IB isoform X2 [Scophthalmus maximus]XP_035463805.2 high affinity immunoglobulin gamma Fc receptor IB isoform X2 [Scophthalmus maximus]
MPLPGGKLAERQSHSHVSGRRLSERMFTAQAARQSVSRRWDRMQLTPLCLVLFNFISSPRPCHPLFPPPLPPAACLRLSPDRSQFFRYDTIALNCEDCSNSTGWKVKRRTLEGGVWPCSTSWGTTTSGSTCTIGNIYPSDSGVYWCESAGGERTNSVNITITDHPVVLESPVLPVPEGAAVTLRCKAETFSAAHVFHFFKDGRPIGSSSSGEVTLHSVSKSDEGLYKCGISGGEESIASWLAVGGEYNVWKSCFSDKASCPPSCSSQPGASYSVPVFRLMFHLLVGTPYLVSTILLGLIYRDRKKAARTVAERRGSNDVIMEIVVSPD